MTDLKKPIIFDQSNRNTFEYQALGARRAQTRQTRESMHTMALQVAPKDSKATVF